MSKNTQNIKLKFNSQVCILKYMHLIYRMKDKIRYQNTQRLTLDTNCMYFYLLDNVFPRNLKSTKKHTPKRKPYIVHELIDTYTKLFRSKIYMFKSINFDYCIPHTLLMNAIDKYMPPSKLKLRLQNYCMYIMGKALCYVCKQLLKSDESIYCQYCLNTSFVNTEETNAKDKMHILYELRQFGCYDNSSLPVLWNLKILGTIDKRNKNNYMSLFFDDEYITFFKGTQKLDREVVKKYNGRFVWVRVDKCEFLCQSSKRKPLWQKTLKIKIIPKTLIRLTRMHLKYETISDIKLRSKSHI